MLAGIKCIVVTFKTITHLLLLLLLVVMMSVRRDWTERLVARWFSAISEASSRRRFSLTAVTADIEMP